jgi:hypothetical protein
MQEPKNVVGQLDIQHEEMKYHPPISPPPRQALPQVRKAAQLSDRSDFGQLFPRQNAFHELTAWFRTGRL